MDTVLGKFRSRDSNGRETQNGVLSVHSVHGEERSGAGSLLIPETRPPSGRAAHQRKLRAHSKTA